MVVGGEGAVGVSEDPEGVDSQVPGLAEVEANAMNRRPIFSMREAVSRCVLRR